MPYTAPTDSEIRNMPKGQRKAIYDQHRVANLGGQFRRINNEWHVAVALEFLRSTPKVGDRIEVEVRKQGQRRGELQTIDVYKIADDERFALPTAYGTIAKPDLPEGIRNCIELIGYSDYGYKSFEDAEDDMELRSMFDIDDWNACIDQGYIDIRRVNYKLTDAGYNIFRNL